MTDPSSVVRLQGLLHAEIRPLVVESISQGFTFVDRLVTEFENGTNRFDKPGEALFGLYQQQQLIGVGGLNRDPYLGDDKAGRVRHLYVLADFRRQGVGRRLLSHIVKEATAHYAYLTLRTFNPDADRLYRALGFQTEPRSDQATHWMSLSA